MSNVKCKFQVDATVGNNTRRQTVTNLLYLTTPTLYNNLAIRSVNELVNQFQSQSKRERKIYDFCLVLSVSIKLDKKYCVVGQK